VSVNRRKFIQNTALGVTAAVTLPGEPFSAPGSDPQPTNPQKFILSAPLTHSDWMLRPNIPWDEEGVQHMLDACKACGWSRIYWRVLDGGRSLYASSLLNPMGKWDEDSFWSPKGDADRALVKRYSSNMTDAQRAEFVKKFDALDYGKFDSFRSALDYGHKIGLQIHAWVSINEDDHGWGLQSRFSKAHPEFRWQGRNRKKYHSQLSFSFPQVREYKLQILEELLAKYDLDGLFLDWIRTGDVRDNPQNDRNGVADYGYEMASSFRKRFGKDPEKLANDDAEWVRFRAERQTEFMRQVRNLATKRRPGLPIAALVGHPWHYRGEIDKIDGNLRGLLLDVPAWVKEKLVDALVPAGYYRDGGNAELAVEALRKETQNRVDVWTYTWVPSTVAELEQTTATATKLNCKQILFWEADYIDARANRTELMTAIKAKAI